MHITLENVLFLCGTVAAVATTWGIMKAQIRTMRVNLKETNEKLEIYRSRTDVELDRIRAYQEQQIDKFHEACRLYRSECRANLMNDTDRIETKLDNLDTKIDEQTRMFIDKIDSLVKYFHDKLQASEESQRSLREDVAGLKAIGKVRSRE